MARNLMKATERWLKKYRSHNKNSCVAPFIRWKGFKMGLEEAEYILGKLEQQKLTAQNRMTNTQMGGAITGLVLDVLGSAAITTGNAMPIPGVRDIIRQAGTGTSELGGALGATITEMGTVFGGKHCQGVIEFIDSLEEAIDEALDR